MQGIERRLKALEEVAKSHGVKVNDNMVEADQCTIN